MASIPQIQGEFWKRRSLGPEAHHHKLSKEAGQTIWQFQRDRFAEWQARDNQVGDEDPRPDHLTYAHEATGPETGQQIIQAHWQGSSLEAQFSQGDLEEPFEYFSSQEIEGGLITLSLIPGNASVWALATFLSDKENFRQRKEFS